MLETLRDYGASLLAGTGEQEQAAAAMAGYALRVAEEAAAGLQTGTAEIAAALRLDAEDVMMSQVLAWALRHDPAVALRLVLALAPWWLLRGRLAVGNPLLREAASRAETGSGQWCAAHYWLGLAAQNSANLDGALGHFTAVRDAIGDRALSPVLADCLSSRSLTLSNLGGTAEAAEEGRRALALARELRYPAGEALALVAQTIAALCAEDFGGAVQLARQAAQISADIPGSLARRCTRILTDALTENGDLAAAESICAAGLARSREAGDLSNQVRLLTKMAVLDLLAGRVENAAAQLREELQINLRAGDRGDMLNVLNCCGYLCAATRRPADAVTVWAAYAALSLHEGFGGAAPFAHLQQGLLRKARRELVPARARVAEERGTVMNWATAAEYALLLTAAQPGRPQAPPEGGKLSARERELVTLVAQGRTNAQIAAQLYISIRTVGSHLDRIRDKTGCRRRADLTRLALSAGLV
jgi:DNA-binding CsgD family transcriptional regulator